MGLPDGFNLQGYLVGFDIMGYAGIYFMCGSALGVTVGRLHRRQLHIIYMIAVGSYGPGPALK